MKEKYYAVRIGDPRNSSPYFMLDRSGITPWLFTTRHEAELFRPKEPWAKVVRVWLTTK